MSVRTAMTDNIMDRRVFLRGTLAGGVTGVAMMDGGVPLLASETPDSDKPTSGQKQVLFIWLAGGSSQFEMWDPKPGRETGGPFRTIPTAIPGYQCCELMPKLAGMMDRLTVVRSLDTGITAHAPAADLVSTGRTKEPSLVYPEIGVILARELARPHSNLPGYISIFRSTEGRRRPSTGFYGGHYAPVLLEEGIRPRNIDVPDGLSSDQYNEREKLRRLFSEKFAERRAGGELVDSYNGAFDRARGLMDSHEVFNVDAEPEAERLKYGPTEFGRHALLARRLLEAGVPVVKVARGFWDSHHDNFESHRELVPDFDNVMSVLLEDLQQRGILDHTHVFVLSEFGRTPKINKDVGRDHYAAAWSFMMAGFGVQPGAVFGKTDKDGIEVADGKAGPGDIAATIYRAVGCDPWKHYMFGQRPVPLAPEDAEPIEAVLA